MEIHIHHHDHLDGKDLKTLLVLKQGQFSLCEKLDKVLEALKIMSDKLDNQEKQLQGLIGQIQTGLVGLKTGFDGVIARLETKNDSTPEVDLTDELSDLRTVSGTIDEMATRLQASNGATSGETTGSGSTGVEVPPTGSGTTESEAPSSGDATEVNQPFVPGDGDSDGVDGNDGGRRLVNG